MNFHRNPEEVRAEKEAKRHEQNFYKTQRNQRYQKQGDESSQAQRRKKDMNKQYVGNHNRKTASARKMAKGMR